MKSFLVIFLTYHITLSFSILIKITGKKEEYCFEKELPIEEVIRFNYVISSSQPEDVIIKIKCNADQSTLFSETTKQSGDFKSKVLDSGNYTLCFYPLLTGDNKFYISFNYYSESETGMVLDLAQDKELKNANNNLKQLSAAFLDFENNLSYLIDRRMTHYIMLMDIIKTLKNISYLKIAMACLLSILQIFFIRQFFGNEERKVKVPGVDTYSL